MSSKTDCNRFLIIFSHFLLRRNPTQPEPLKRRTPRCSSDNQCGIGAECGPRGRHFFPNCLARLPNGCKVRTNMIRSLLAKRPSRRCTPVQDVGANFEDNRVTSLYQPNCAFGPTRD